MQRNRKAVQGDPADATNPRMLSFDAAKPQSKFQRAKAMKEKEMKKNGDVGDVGDVGGTCPPLSERSRTAPRYTQSLYCCPWLGE
jgi:hypothetical protein